MRTRTSPRRLARQQRQHLEAQGWSEHDIEVFARIFKTAEEPDPDLPPCEQTR